MISGYNALNWSNVFIGLSQYTVSTDGYRNTCTPPSFCNTCNAVSITSAGNSVLTTSWASVIAFVGFHRIKCRTKMDSTGCPVAIKSTRHVSSSRALHGSLI